MGYTKQARFRGRTARTLHAVVETDLKKMGGRPPAFLGLCHLEGNTMRRVKRYGLVIAAVLIIGGHNADADPVGTGFTYQGQLKQAGAPYTGVADFQFRAYDAAAGGAAVGPLVTQLNVAVDNGLFMVSLDFGANVFSGAPRWLAIAARVPAAGGAYVPIVPRQPVAPTPYSMLSGHAETVADNSVDSDSVVNGSIQPGDLSFTPGDITSVGAGPGLTGGALSGAANLAVDFSGSGNAATASRSNHWHSALNASDGNPTDALTVDTTGDVSIGTATSTHRLTVADDGDDTLRLMGPGSFGSGSRLNFGDADWAYIDEPIDDDLTIHCEDGGGAAGGGKLTLDADVVEVSRGTDVSPAGGAYLRFGAPTGVNLAIDNNELMVRNNGVASTLSINHEGGDVHIGSSGTGNVGVGTNTPSSTAKMHVVSDAFSRGILATSASGGTGSYGVYAESTATSGTGLRGVANTGSSAWGIWGSSTSDEAGHFSGDVVVTGSLSKGGGSFKIDHPLDPANKYLLHSFVESPDMMNIYNGVVVLDGEGAARITMPEWFDVLNRDFRYQLTAIGAPGPNLYIAEELQGNQFGIAGGDPGMKVSWEITGIRQDKWAEAYRIPVEEVKPDDEKGLYLHPELYGLSRDHAIEAPKERAWQEAVETEAEARDRADHQAAEALRQPAGDLPSKKETLE